jgi:hypothetical protein
MAMSSRLLAGAVLLFLAACQSTPPVTRVAPQAGSLDAGWGEASKWNAAVQTINPEPVYTADMAQPGDSGAKAADAAKRYRTDQVKELESPSTTKRAGKGSSGPR